MNMPKKIFFNGEEVIVNGQPTLNRKNSMTTFRIVKEKTPLDKYDPDSIEYRIMRRSDEYKKYEKKRKRINIPVMISPVPCYSIMDSYDMWIPPIHFDFSKRDYCMYLCKIMSCFSVHLRKHICMNYL